MTVSVEIGPGNPLEADFRVDIRPNASMSPRGLAVALICLTVVCLTIALSFLSLGAWPVLPFAGLELFTVGMAVGYTIRRSGDCEVILVSGADVTVTQSSRSKTRKYTFSRYWARVHLVRGPGRLQRSRLTLGSHGRLVEIGTDLADVERSELAAELKQVLRTGI